MRSVFFLLLGFAVSIAKGQPTGGGEVSSLAGSQPNMVLIIADDLSATDLGCYGNADARTPHLDKLAQEGRQWTRAYLTATVCSPSRSSIITGRYPHNSGASTLHTGVTPGQPLFPKVLRESGYWTGQAGKWHMGGYPKDAGAFDRIIEREEGVAFREQFIPLLRERPEDKPFFAWLGFGDPHRAWSNDPEAEPHDPETLRLPVPLVDTPTTRRDLASFYDEVQRLDRFVGKVLDELQRQDVLDETLVLFIADNGRPFPRAKRWLTEEGIRTPWLIHWPEGLRGDTRACHELVSAIDIAPTFLELAGAAVPEGFQGRSFIPQLEDPSAKICDYFFAERNWQVMFCHERTLRHGDWSYYRNAAPELRHFGFVNATFYAWASYADLWKMAQSGEMLTPAQKSVFLQPRPQEQLFHVKDDPMEVRDLAGDPDYRDVLVKLRAKMDAWIERTGDTVPPPDRRLPDRHDRLTGERRFGDLTTWITKSPARRPTPPISTTQARASASMVSRHPSRRM